MTAPAFTARQLAKEIGRLSPDWRNPERYFENRHEIESELQRLARQLERMSDIKKDARRD